MRAEVRRVVPDDWAAFRAIRLEALADTPIGFLEVHAEALTRSDAQWRDLTADASAGEEHALWLAHQDGQVVGCVGGLVRGLDGGAALGHDREPRSAALAYTVYVSPPARSAGVLEQLFSALEQWAGTLPGVTELRLEVHEDNARARAAYRRLGFVETGEHFPYPADPSRRELMMARPVRTA